MDGSSNAAAWVQAVGSILAILASVGIVLWQNRVAVRARRTADLEEDIRHLEAAQQLVDGTKTICLKHSKEQRADLSNAHGTSILLAQLQAVNDAMASVDHTRVGGYVGIEAILTSLSASRTIVRFVENALADRFKFPIDGAYIADLCSGCAEITSDRSEKLAAAIGRRRSST